MSTKTFTDLKKEVIDTGLCTRCGTCVGICKEQSICFSDPLGACLPVMTVQCDKCNGICYDGCPGKEVLWPALNQQIFNKQPDNYLLGNYLHAYLGFAKDSTVRNGASSGGIISAISIYLLENNLVDGVVTLVEDENEPYRSVPRIISDPAVILSAAQSKYSISPVNTIFQELVDRPGIYSYVGLPCQVHSLRKLQQIGHPATVNIKYVVGLYCGNVLHFDAIRSYLRRNDVEDLSQISSLKYRAGEWPGRLEIHLRDGRSFGMGKFYANYLIPFYVMKRCLLCTDLTNEFADIAVGDGWAPVYNDRGKGWSIALARSQLGDNVLREMETSELIEIHKITEEAIINMHSHGLDLKKRGAFLRMHFRQKQGKPIPNYGYTLGEVPFRRWLQEILMHLIFWLCGFEASRRIINVLPLNFIGQAFKYFRMLWIRSTQSTKRKGLMKSSFLTVTDAAMGSFKDKAAS